jgi:hypothetical protein
VLQGICLEVRLIKRDPFWHDPLKRYLGYVSSLPRDIYSGYSQEMARAICEIQQSYRFDLAIAFQLDTAVYVLQTSHIPRILEIDNLMTRWAEERFRSQDNPISKAGRWVNWQKCRRYERQIFNQFDALTVVSELDDRSVEYHTWVSRADRDYSQQGWTRRRGGRNSSRKADTLVFNGALTYANAEAMRFLSGKRFPGSGNGVRG